MATAEATREFTKETKELGDKIVSLTLKAAKELSDYGGGCGSRRRCRRPCRGGG